MSSSYFLVVAGIFFAKFIGLFRDVVFASVFGTTALSDIYFQIFSLVTLVFSGVGVALQTVLIKNLNKTEISTKEMQQEYTRKFITKISLALALVTAFLYIFARPFTQMLLPEVTGQNFEIAVKLTYVMLPSFWCVVIAYIISGALQNRQVFFISSIMSLPYNVVILASLMFKNIDIITVGVVTTIGWLLHILVQLPWFYKQGYSLFLPKEKLESPLLVKSSNREILWIFISNMMFQLCFVIDKAFVSGQEGMIASINYASNLFIQISGVFVVAMSSVVFPSISKNYEEGNVEKVRKDLRYMMTIMVAIFVALLLTITLFGEEIIRLIYERGSFTAESTRATALVFTIYCFGVFGYVAQELFNKVLYLGSKYAYTVIGTICVIALKVIVDLYATSVEMISISTSILLTLYAVVVAIAIKKVIGKYINKELVVNVVKILIAGFLATLVYIAFNMFAGGMISHKILFVVPLLACAVVYLGALYVMKIVKYILQKEPEN